MTSVEPSSVGQGTGLGGDVIVTSANQAYLIEYQCVTSHGHETVSDAIIKTNVEYAVGMAVLKPFKYNVNESNSKKGLVHIPIHNPPAMTLAAYLQNIVVKFDSVDDATVRSVSLYYDNIMKVIVSMNESDTFHINFNAKEAKEYAYEIPKGISVALDLRFPNAASCINLFSVTLVYKATVESI